MESRRENGLITDPIYERDGYIRQFSATVISSEKVTDGYDIVLDVTAFFPEGGGQQPDEGMLDGQKVLNVQIRDGAIYHTVKEPIEVGSQIIGQVDNMIRLRRMQQHCAEHLVCGLIYEKYGYSNSGFHMNDEEVIFDVDGPLTEDDIAEIERKANEVVANNVPVTISFPSEEEARSLTYRSKLDTFSNIRLVTIEGYDVCACCAPMLDSTGQIGVIKITSWMPHRGGMRMSLLAGISAYEDYALLDINNKNAQAILSAKRYETADKLAELSGKEKKLYEENISLKKEITNIISKTYIKEIKERQTDDKSPVIIFTESLDNVQLRELINSCTGAGTCFVAGFIGNDTNGYRYILSASSSYDFSLVGASGLKEYASIFNEKLGARGGGNDQMISGSVSASREKIEEFLKK